MESGPTTQEFVLNVAEATGPEGDQKKIAIEWLGKFEESNEAINTCLEVLKSSVDDKVKLYTIRVVQNMVKNTSAFIEKKFVMETYHFFIDFLKMSQDLEITTQACIVLVALFTNTKSFIYLVSEILNDILSLVPESKQKCSCPGDDFFSKKTAIIFLRELFSDIRLFEDPKLSAVRSKIESECEKLSLILIDIMKAFERNRGYLRETSGVYWKITSVFHQNNIMESIFFMKVCEMLRTLDTDNSDFLCVCLRYVGKRIGHFETMYDGETECQYRFFCSLVKDLRRFVDAAVLRDDQDLICTFAYIVEILSDKFFDAYINSLKETEFSVFEELNRLCELDNIYLYNIAIVFWSKFEKDSSLLHCPKFKSFTQKFGDIFVNQMLRALTLTEPMMNECLEIHTDRFIVDFRENIRIALDILFKFLSPEPYLNRAVSIMHAYPHEPLQIEPWLFVVSAMITTTNFPADFKDVLKFIITLPSDAPSLLMKTSCEFLRDFIDNADNRKKYSEMPEISLESMYKWLARVPGPTSRAFLSQREPRRPIFQHDMTELDCDYLNNIIVHCQQQDGVASLVGCVVKLIFNSCKYTKLDLFRRFMDFQLKAVIQESEKTPNRKESVRFADCIMTSLTIFVNQVESFLTDEFDFQPTIDETIDLCVQVFNNYRDNEDVCDKMCHVLTFTIHLSKDYYNEHQKLCDHLVRFYQDLNFSCFIEPFQMIYSLRGYDAGFWEWILKHCIVIFDHAVAYLTTKDLNNHLRFVGPLMNFFRTVVAQYYDDILHSFDVGRLLSIASQGLLSEDERTFHECFEVLFEVFMHPSKQLCKSRPQTEQIVERLYHSRVRKIIKNTINMILSTRKIVLLKCCGDVLYLMNRTERCLVGTCLNIAQDLVYKALENYQDIICPEQKIEDILIKILNSTTKEEAESLACLINIDS